ncbi:M23 family metallopeptidase [Bacillus massiliigorillae]|uniref:M23 family metallopeptidase n=1 Tax=Bacillus massiliigorillae TaxID=1243664 RepID=UPI0003A49C95|nr:M23 family metallopeptidase [Bacillus massiliigorillae]
MREDEKKRNSQKSGMRRFLSKRWALPAIYLASAAILLTAVIWFQNSNNDSANPGEVEVEQVENAGKNSGNEAVEVNSKVENFSWPVVKQDNAVVKKEFYDINGDKAKQENALVFYDNQYHLNRGIDIAMKDGKAFDVTAALSGKVTKVKEDALLGNVIEVEHVKGITTSYQSVTDIAVKEGDTVTKGQALAKAGQSLLNKDAGIHVHFEIRKDSVAVNPQDYFDKSVSSLMEAEVVNGTPTEDVKTTTEESKKDQSNKEDSSLENDSYEENSTNAQEQN